LVGICWVLWVKSIFGEKGSEEKSNEGEENEEEYE